MGAVIISGSAELASKRDEVWPLIADTERMNRWLGMAPVTPHAAPEGTHSAARFVVETRNAGMSTSYEEFPFEWTTGREFRVLRKMRNGPLETMRMIFKLDDVE